MLVKQKKLKKGFYTYNMYYGKIKKYDISNGPGVRTSLYVSGCRNHCKGCFNPETWNFLYGHEFTDDTLKEIIDASKPDYIEGITIVGGEPLEPENQETVLEIIKEFKKRYPSKTIWMFSGYTYDGQIKKWCKELPWTKEIINNLDVLVDGKFEIDLKDPELGFRGSSNQRIIDIKKTLKEGKIVLHEKQYNKETKKVWN